MADYTQLLKDAPLPVVGQGIISEYPPIKAVETKNGLWTFHFTDGTKRWTRDPELAEILLRAAFPDPPDNDPEGKPYGEKE